MEFDKDRRDEIFSLVRQELNSDRKERIHIKMNRYLLTISIDEKSQ